MKKLISLVLIALLCLGLLASCGNPGLDKAVERLNSVMVSMPENTGADYDVYGKLSISNVEYTITWTVADAEGNAIDSITVGEINDEGLVTINVPEDAEADIPYVLTATIKDPKGNTKTLSFNRKVPKFVELTWSQFQGTADDEAVVIKGIVTGIVNTDTKHEIYLQDNDGGYYVYNIAADQLTGLAVGMEIRVRGVKDTYYGVHQVINASVEILNSTPAPKAPVDITEAFKAAASTADKGLTNNYQSMLVTIKGVTILGQVSGDTTYYDFLLMYEGPNGITAKQTYLRLSGSANMMDSATTNNFKTAYNNAIRKDADVTGIVSVYNNALYLIPVSASAVDNVATKERTEAEQVEFEKLIMDSVTSITNAGEVTLATKGKAYSNVTITWALEANDAATLDGNVIKVPVLLDNAVTAKLTATITAGSATATREFTLNVAAAPTHVPSAVTTPATGVAYKFMFKQVNLGQSLYWNGRFDGSKLAVTPNPTEAVDVYLEETTGGYFFYIGTGEAKQYLVVTDVNGTATPSLVRARNFNAATANVYTYDATVGALCTTIDLTNKDGNTTSNTLWFGTYNKNNTIGLSAKSYINESNVQVSQFPARFYTLIAVADKTPAQQIEAEKNALTLPLSVTKDGTIATLIKNGETFVQVQIAWDVPAGQTALTVVNGKLNATLQAAETTVTVTATFTLKGATETKTFDIVVAAKPAISLGVVEAPVVGTAYKFGLKHGGLGDARRYFNGDINAPTTPWYLGSTDDLTAAVDVYLEAVDGVDGAYRLYFMKGTDKTYIRAYPRDGDTTKGTLELTTTQPTESYTFNAEYNTLVYTSTSGEQFFLGSSGTYTSISCSAISYITSGTNYITHLYAEGATGSEDGTTNPPAGDDTTGSGVTPLKTGDKVVIAAPAYNKLLSMTKTGNYNVGVDYTGTDYSVATNDEIFVVTLNGDGSYTFTSLSGKVLAISAEYSSLDDTSANDDWVLEVIDGKADQYLVKNVVKGNYLEWYNKYSNWSTYASSSAATDDQFHLAFYVIEAAQGGGSGSVTPDPEPTPDPDPTPDPEPEPTPEPATMPYTAGVAYKLYIMQAELNAKYYFTGLTIAGKDYRLETTDWVYDAVDVFIEEVKESDLVVGFRFYFMKDSTKTYIDAFANGTYLNIRLTTEPTAVFTYNETYGSFVTTLGTTETYLGSYSANTYIQASATSYISGPNASKLGVSQYVIKFELSSDVPALDDQKKVDRVKDNLTVQDSFSADATLTLPVAILDGVTITWTKDGVAYADATVAITQTSDVQNIVLVATITSGSVSTQKEFTVTVAAKPAAGTTVTHTADFSGFSKNTGYGDRTSDIWSATNAAILVGGTKDADGEFSAIGADGNSKAVCLNGKTTGVGSLTSSTINGGISALKFNYGAMFSETKLGVTITITKADGTSVSTTLSDTTITKLATEEFEWVLDEVITGDFTITITNSSPSNSTSNKDRIAIWNLQWTSAPAV